MPFAKRKTGRTLTQRLSDQRRSLALGGLAVGAVLSAAIFRRKRRGGEAEFGSPIPPVKPATQPESGPPAAVEVPPPASEPELVAAEAAAAPAPASAAGPANAAATPGPTTAPEPVVAPRSTSAPDRPVPAPSSAPFDPPTGELSAEEASILAVLAQSGRADDDRTAIAVATSLERETTDVAAVLRKLGTEGIVSGELYTATGDKIWAVTERGVRRLGAQS